MKKITTQFLNILNGIFTPPGLVDEEQIQTSRLLAAYHWTFILILAVGCVILIITSPSQILRPMGVMLVVALLNLSLYIFLKRGWIRFSNILTIGLTWLLLTGGILTGGGVHSAAYVGYFMLTFLAGITLGGHAMLFVAALSIAAGTGMEYLEVQGLLPAARYIFTPFQYLVLQSVMLIMLVLMQHYASWIVKESQRKTRDEINERKQKELQLSDSQKRFAAIFENSPTPTAISNAKTSRLIDVNPAWQQQWGHTRESVVGKKALDIGLWVNPEERQRMLAEVSTYGPTQNFETVLHSNLKGNRQVSISVGPVEIDGEECLIFQTIDITEKRELERSLQQSNERFDQISKHIPEVFWISENIGGLVYLSPAFELIFGRKVEDLYEGRYQFIDMIIPEDQPKIKYLLERQRQGAATQAEYRIHRPDGSLRWIYDRSFPVLGQQGQRLRTIGVATDITEQKRAEAERRELTSILEDAEQQVGIASWSHNVSTRTAHWSPHMFILFGFNPTEGIPPTKIFLEHIHPADRPFLREALKAMAKGIEVEEQHIYRTNPAQGEMRVLQPTYRVEKDMYGKIIKFFGTVLDITERKRAEYELESRQKLLEKVIHSGKNITAITDLEACLHEIHANITNHLGFDRARVFLYDAETHLIQGQYGLDSAGHLQKDETYQESIKENEAWQSVLQNPTGVLITQDTQPSALPTSQNEKCKVKLAAWSGEAPVALLEVDNCPTQRPINTAELEALQLFAGYAGLALENAKLHTGLEKLVAEQTNELRLSEATYRALFEKANDGIFLLSPEGRELRANQYALDMLGYTEQEFWEISRTKQNPFATDPDQRTDANQKMEAIKRGERVEPYERIFTKKNGQKVLVEINLSSIRGEAGKIVMIQSVVRDITQRKQAEETLRRANLEMKQALRMKDEFLANMSHELRTPLNAVLGLSESMLEGTAGPLAPKQTKYLNTINESGKHLLELINDILDIAKIESGQVQLELARVDIARVCESSVRIVSQLAKNKKQKVNLHIAEGVQFVRADERRLKQMIFNLLSNGIKFTPMQGQVGIEVKPNEEKNKLHIEIWDTGIGIQKKDQDRIFQPFVQLDSGLARENSGTGLGLALVSQMVHLHGGTISVASEPGLGSRFILVLPWSPADNLPNTLAL